MDKVQQFSYALVIEGQHIGCCGLALGFLQQEEWFRASDGTFVQNGSGVAGWALEFNDGSYGIFLDHKLMRMSPTDDKYIEWYDEPA